MKNAELREENREMMVSNNCWRGYEISSLRLRYADGGYLCRRSTSMLFRIAFKGTCCKFWPSHPRISHNVTSMGNGAYRVLVLTCAVGVCSPSLEGWTTHSDKRTGRRLPYRHSRKTRRSPSHDTLLRMTFIFLRTWSLVKADDDDRASRSHKRRRKSH